MLRSVLFDGFRSFDGNIPLAFAPLTILAGPNNVGKSSVIQALLAFVQSEQAQSGSTLLLNGTWVDLGGFDQVLNAARPSDRRSFSIGFTGEILPPIIVDLLWRFGPPEDPTLPAAEILELEYNLRTSSSDTTGQVLRAPGDFHEWTEERIDTENQRQFERGGKANFAHPSDFSAFIMNPHTLGSLSERYLGDHHLRLSPFSAARTHHVGPFRAPPQPLYTPRPSPLGPPLGRYGEHTAELLFRNRTQRTDVLPPTREGDGQPLPMLSAVNAWWSYIFGGSLALQIDAPARLGYTLAIDTPSAERLGLGQVGLGLSQALPIVATCLASKPNELILVETPEAHLHPGAQHRLTNLFIEAARRGRQVVLETHSEHILHAAYLAVKSGFPAEDVAINFFEQQEGRTAVQRIGLDPHGRALRAPQGFFDQAAIDLAELLR